MTERKVLYLKFTTDSGKSTSVTIADPKEDLTLDAVKQVAAKITDSKALEGADMAPLTVFQKAYTVKTITEELQ